MSVRVLVLRTAGTNDDLAGIEAFAQAGAQPEHRHVHDIYQHPAEIQKYQIILFPGGFSYGDDLAAGKIQAVETKLFLFDELSRFVDKGGFILGICNGFQVLVKTGLLPGRVRGQQEVSLTYNVSNQYEDRWVRLRVADNCQCAFLPKGWIFEVPAAHGEGRFIPANQELAKQLSSSGQVALRYVDENGNPTMQYPDNPNGSMDAIAGLCDPTGRILGLMPHPERHVFAHHHPNWSRSETQNAGEGLRFFQELVRFVG